MFFSPISHQRSFTAFVSPYRAGIVPSPKGCWGIPGIAPVEIAAASSAVVATEALARTTKPYTIEAEMRGRPADGAVHVTLLPATSLRMYRATADRVWFAST
jgi:hypothetical protein